MIVFLFGLSFNIKPDGRPLGVRRNNILFESVLH